MQKHSIAIPNKSGRAETSAEFSLFQARRRFIYIYTCPSPPYICPRAGARRNSNEQGARNAISLFTRGPTAARVRHN